MKLFNSDLRFVRWRWNAENSSSKETPSSHTYNKAREEEKWSELNRIFTGRLNWMRVCVPFWFHEHRWWFPHLSSLSARHAGHPRSYSFEQLRVPAALRTRSELPGACPKTHARGSTFSPALSMRIVELGGAANCVQCDRCTYALHRKLFAECAVGVCQVRGLLTLPVAVKSEFLQCRQHLPHLAPHLLVVSLQRTQLLLNTSAVSLWRRQKLHTAEPTILSLVILLWWIQLRVLLVPHYYTSMHSSSFTANPEVYSYHAWNLQNFCTYKDKSSHNICHVSPQTTSSNIMKHTLGLSQNTFLIG